MNEVSDITWPIQSWKLNAYFRSDFKFLFRPRERWAMWVAALFCFGVISVCWGLCSFEEQWLFFSKPRQMTAVVGSLSKLLLGKGHRLGWERSWSLALAAWCQSFSALWLPNLAKPAPSATYTSARAILKLSPYLLYPRGSLGEGPHQGNRNEGIPVLKKKGAKKETQSKR